MSPPTFGETVQVSEGRAAEIALNREVWAIVNERFTNGAAERMWGMPEVVWGLFAVPERELVVTGTVAAADGDRLEVACAVSQDGREVISDGVAGLELPDRRPG